MVLGQQENCPLPNPKIDPNPNPNRGAIFLGGNYPDTQNYIT